MKKKAFLVFLQLLHVGGFHFFLKTKKQGHCDTCAFSRSLVDEDDLLPRAIPVKSDNRAPRQRQRQERRDNRRCYICGDTGHLARNCPESSSAKNDGSRRIFVSGLASETDWGSLKDHFRKNRFKVVYASVSMDYDGHSKCCGIVQFETPEEAQRAINNMSGSLLDGASISLREDRKNSK